jgi:hypothetical protein
MICNPSEPIGNMDLYYPFSIPVGTGLRLVTGNATVPGNFGWLDNGIGNGTQALASALGNDEPPGDCEDYEGVSTKTGMDAAVLKAFNTRFDIFANGGTTCPQGVCSPSTNARKDVVCASSTGVSCTNDNWSFSTKPYRPTAASALPLDGSADPDIMGYPRDYCHAVPAASQCGVTGTGNWDRDAYFRVNYGWANQAAWTFGTGLPATATRYQVYNWELAHPTVTVNGVARGIGVPQLLSGNKAAFGRPATGRAGIDPSSGIDKRRLTVAMLNCIALNLKGETSNIPVSKWMDVFTVEPALQRGSGANAYTDQKDIYVEVIAETGSGQYGASTGQIVMRAVPLLIR